MQNNPSPSAAREPWFPIVLLLVLYGLVDFWAPAIAAPLLNERERENVAITLSVAFIGCVLGQLSAAAAWGVLGVGRPVVRWASGVATAAAALSLVFAGDMLAGARGSQWPDLLDLLDLLRALPLAYLSAQAPIWVLSCGWGWRFVAPGAAVASPQRFTLRGLFIATTIVAVALALPLVGRLPATRDEGLFAIALCLIGGSIWGLLAIAPCLFAAFLPRTLGRGVAFATFYVAALWLGVAAAMLASGGRSPAGERALLLLLCVSYFGSLAFTLAGSCFVLRHCGYALRRIKIAADARTADRRSAAE